VTGPRDRRAPDDALQERVRGLPREIAPPDDVWPAVAARLAPGAAPRPIPGPDRAWGLGPPPRFISWRVHPALAAAAVLALGAALWLHARSVPAWRVSFTAGRPTLAGGVLTTDSASAARVGVGGGRLGEVDVEPRSHVRLLRAAGLERRLVLDVGTIRARISAPRGVSRNIRTRRSCAQGVRSTNPRASSRSTMPVMFEASQPSPQAALPIGTGWSGSTRRSSCTCIGESSSSAAMAGMRARSAIISSNSSSQAFMAA